MYHKNDILELTIIDLTVDGLGIGKTAEGIAVFINGALPMEKVRTKIIKIAKNYLVGRLEKILVPSPDRIDPPCPVFHRCGGCTLQHLNYAGQLSYKKSHVKNCLARIGGIDIDVMPVIPSPNTIHYRNKAAFPVAQGKNGIQIGCYATHTHDIVPCESCILQPPEINKCLHTVRRWMEQFHIPAYSEDTHKGLVRHIVVRKTSIGEIMLAVVATDKIPHTSELINMLSEISGIKSILLNINRQQTNVILGKETFVLYGTKTVQEKILGNLFQISLPSFLQVNTACAEKLYNIVYDLAKIDEKMVVADLYCGAGTITLGAALRAKEVYGIEIVPEAIANAKENAKINNITNTTFLCGDCADIFPQLLQNNKMPDVILVDPPRKGLSEKTILDICASRIEKIVYISCDPATLARDLKIFQEHQFQVKIVQPVDMFPQTTHVETVVLMARVEERNKV